MARLRCEIAIKRPRTFPRPDVAPPFPGTADLRSAAGRIPLVPEKLVSGELGRIKEDCTDSRPTFREIHGSPTVVQHSGNASSSYNRTVGSPSSYISGKGVATSSRRSCAHFERHHRSAPPFDPSWRSTRP